MQVIKALDGELGTNHSLAGSMVSGNLSTSAMSYERIEKLGTNGIPDIILISAGCNDWGFCVLPEEFEEAYRTMLHRIKEQYPHADIYCATLPEGKQPQGETFFNIDSTISKRVYSDIIRENAQKAQVYIADLANVQEEYETVDGVHPNKAGMHTLAQMWVRMQTARIFAAREAAKFFTTRIRPRSIRYRRTTLGRSQFRARSQLSMTMRCMDVRTPLVS